MAWPSELICTVWSWHWYAGWRRSTSTKTPGRHVAGFWHKQPHSATKYKARSARRKKDPATFLERDWLANHTASFANIFLGRDFCLLRLRCFINILLWGTWNCWSLERKLTLPSIVQDHEDSTMCPAFYCRIGTLRKTQTLVRSFLTYWSEN